MDKDQKPQSPSDRSAEKKPSQPSGGNLVWYMLGLGVLLIVCFGISLGNSFVTPTLNGLASRSTDAHCQGRLLGLMQSAGSLGRFLGPVIGFRLVAHDPAGQYGRTSFFASAAILTFALLCILFVTPAPESAPVPEVIPEG